MPPFFGGIAGCCIGFSDVLLAQQRAASASGFANSASIASDQTAASAQTAFSTASSIVASPQEKRLAQENEHGTLLP